MKQVTGGSKGTAREVDLHLKPGYQGKDAIERQAALFRSAMDSAARKGTRQIIFIHGAGSGRLREELLRILREEYPTAEYQDAPFSRYGYQSALLVTIKK